MKIFRKTEKFSGPAHFNPQPTTHNPKLYQARGPRIILKHLTNLQICAILKSKEVVQSREDEFMQKKYSLDYSIERDVDRLAAVNDILDTLDTDPSSADLEQLATYILYGKDENGLNAVKRGEVTDGDKRYSTFLRKDDKNESLNAILENPTIPQETLEEVKPKTNYIIKRPAINRPKYDKKTGALIDVGDGDIPGMQELWAEIDRLEHTVAVNEGKVPPDENTQIFTDSYRYYQFKHMLVDLRRHQYYLKDAYRPYLHFVAVAPSKSQTYDWSADSFYWIGYEEWQKRIQNSYTSAISKNLDDYETRIDQENGKLEVKWVVREHTFDWENPKHIRALLNNYSDIYMQTWDKLDSWGRTLIFDFDRYSDMANFSPVRLHILTRRIDKAPLHEILDELQEKFGIKYNENHLSSILSKEIPEKIALAAKKHRMELEYPLYKKKKCNICKKYFPRDIVFFSRNRGRPDGFSSNCKECERRRRIEKGGQTAYDRRSKESVMH